MKKLLIGLMLLSSITSQASKSISHETCEIAIPTFEISYYVFTVQESNLQELRNKGYTTYEVSKADQIEGSGLNLGWSFQTEEHWHGDTISFEASLKRLSLNKDKNITLYSGKSKKGIDKIFSEFPNCNIK